MLAFSAFSFSILSLAFASIVSAQVSPTDPGDGDSFNEGTTCHIVWTPDTTGKWKNMTIQLMTGGNFDMIPLATVATGIDATSSSDTTFDYTCPQVTPNSAIYFYQFSATGVSDDDNQWTARFTIAGKDGSSTAPLNTTTLGNQTVPCGYGTLLNTNFVASTVSGSSSQTTAAAGSVATVGSSGVSTGTKLVTSAVGKSTATGSATASSATSASSSTSAAAAGVVLNSAALLSLSAVALAFTSLL